MSDTTSTDQHHVAELVKDAKVAMLTTMTEDGKHVSRPMALQEVEFDGDLWFFAYDNSAKAQQIGVHAEVNVSFSDTKGHSWTSLAGTASIVHDRQKAEQLWAKPLQAWFPDGLDTDGLALIKVEAESAEYWEGPSSTVAYIAQVARAAVTRNSDHDPIKNDTVEM
ncbi:pyridoxamine 5'-phosphate oxidase family protein [Curtobacterium sp. Leaf261]|uniref:pyridoxamine 5'-phosphate oxidase family protein n=1 Tax=Curtobacterium sp. Leaf261 TaxID=1736311 RepID=UPI0006FB75B0|nr:pyridoxamine 5'-phosphate oxidase family protein [Curtobacterium sp. Leaf261]KQO62333.1 pyridoxamine 5'-phosphate oxidase [Curtobacterium sp. Leaf261]